MERRRRAQRFCCAQSIFSQDGHLGRKANQGGPTHNLRSTLTLLCANPEGLVCQQRRRPLSLPTANWLTTARQCSKVTFRSHDRPLTTQDTSRLKPNGSSWPPCSALFAGRRERGKGERKYAFFVTPGDKKPKSQRQVGQNKYNSDRKRQGQVNCALNWSRIRTATCALPAPFYEEPVAADHVGRIHTTACSH